MVPMGNADPALERRAASLDAAWLARRRWFRSKTRPLAQVTLADAAPLGSDDAWLLVLAARYGDGGEDHYLVPAVAVPDGSFTEPLDDQGCWRHIVRALAGGSPLLGVAGRFEFHATEALGTLLPHGAEELLRMDERRLTVQQSNTSVRLGDRLLLKIYRLLEPGTNPEVEVNAFLTGTGFTNAPQLGGWIDYVPDRGEAATAAMVQELVSSRGDGWDWALSRLGSPPTGPVEALAGAAVIGGITAEMHQALASDPDAPGFEVRSADAATLQGWRQRAEAQLDAALNAVTGDERARVEAVAGRVRSTFAAIESAGQTTMSRIHGDYHLGQLLRTEASFMVIDFEGEPARPMAERRLPASPLRDVAGMLRSLDYAARTAEREPASSFRPEAWLADARSALLTAYGAPASDQPALLTAFEAEKACYEVRYEANNRPDWTWLPIAALERLAKS
jgi:trehalose synthase-fused probable maltokinase